MNMSPCFLFLLLLAGAAHSTISQSVSNVHNATAPPGSSSNIYLSHEGPPPGVIPGGPGWPPPDPASSPSPSVPQSRPDGPVDATSAFRNSNAFCKGITQETDIKKSQSTYGRLCKKKESYAYTNTDVASFDGTLTTVAAGKYKAGGPDWQVAVDTAQCDHIVEAQWVTRKAMADLSEHMTKTVGGYGAVADSDKAICEALSGKGLSEFKDVFNMDLNLYGVPATVNQFKNQVWKKVVSAGTYVWDIKATDKRNLRKPNPFNPNKAVPALVWYINKHKEDALTAADKTQASIVGLLRDPHVQGALQLYPKDAWRRLLETDIDSSQSELVPKIAEVRDWSTSNNCMSNANGQATLTPKDANGCCPDDSQAQKATPKYNDQGPFKNPQPGQKRKCTCDPAEECCPLDASKVSPRAWFLSRKPFWGRQASDDHCDKDSNDDDDPAPSDDSKPSLPPTPVVPPASVAPVVGEAASWMIGLWPVIAAAATVKEAREQNQKNIDDAIKDKVTPLADDKDHVHECTDFENDLKKLLDAINYHPAIPACAVATTTSARLASAAPTTTTYYGDQRGAAASAYSAQVTRLDLSIKSAQATPTTSSAVHSRR